MNLDPVDIFGETIGGPIKRGFLFYAAMIVGGWIGEISSNIDVHDWTILNWDQFGAGFIWPLGVLVSSAAPLVIGALITFLLISSWLEWVWCAVAAGTSAVILHHYEADLGWVSWFVLNTGLVGLAWLHLTWRRARWAKHLFELNAENAARRIQRQLDQSNDPSKDPLPPEAPD